MSTGSSMMRKAFLVCGIGSSVLYVAMNIIGPMQYEGYSSLSQAVSELSAIGAPSRPLWVVLGIVYDVLLVAFGLGVLISAGGRRTLRIAGGLLVAYGMIGFAWPPMHQRGQGFTLTDTMHIAFSIVTVLLMLVAVGLSAAAMGKRFRRYSIATIVTLVVFGVLTGLDGPRIAANLPTPWVGLLERVNIAAFLLWVVVLAVILLRAQGAAVPRPMLKQTVIPQGVA
jgi:hypothetical protein